MDKNVTQWFILRLFGSWYRGMVCYDPYVKIILIFSVINVIVSIVRVVNSQDIVILRWLIGDWNDRKIRKKKYKISFSTRNHNSASPFSFKTSCLIWRSIFYVSLLRNYKLKRCSFNQAFAEICQRIDNRDLSDKLFH